MIGNEQRHQLWRQEINTRINHCPEPIFVPSCLTRSLKKNTTLCCHILSCNNDFLNLNPTHKIEFKCRLMIGYQQKSTKRDLSYPKMFLY